MLARDIITVISSSQTAERFKIVNFIEEIRKDLPNLTLPASKLDSNDTKSIIDEFLASLIERLKK